VTRIYRIFLAALLAVFALTAAHAASLTGTVTNKTTGKPSAGDTVALLDLAQGMSESAHTTTDSAGRFSFAATAGPHLIQVTHQKASYYASAPPNTTTANVDVYDTAAKLPGVATGIDILRIETDPSGSTLNVDEVFNLRNDSAPPRTQASDRTFDFYIPEGATLGDADATAPGNGAMPTRISPTQVGSEKNHYSVDYSLRPGESLIQVSYTLPYKGKLTLTARPTLATDMVAIQLPKSMSLAAPSNSPFKPVDESPDVATFMARHIASGSSLAFTVSGTGQLPQEQQQQADQSGNGGQGAAAAATDRPGGGMGAPIDTPDPLTKYKWWIIGGLLVILAVVAGFLLSSKPAAAAPHAHAHPLAGPMPNAPLTGRGTLEALKDEMFTLETDRLSGKMSEEDYIKHRAALDLLLQRALKRG
jgi:hypothetical protein